MEFIYLFIWMHSESNQILAVIKAVYSNQTKSLTLGSLGVSLCVVVLNSRIQIDCALHLYHNNQFLSNRWSKCNGSCLKEHIILKRKKKFSFYKLI